MIVPSSWTGWTTQRTYVFQLRAIDDEGASGQPPRQRPLWLPDANTSPSHGASYGDD